MSARFSPAALSPEPVEPTETELPYGLSWRHLQPCLPGFTSSVGARALATYRLRGLRDEAASTVVTLDYPVARPAAAAGAASSAGRARLTVFVKRVDPAAREAAKLRHLAAHGVGAPRVLRLVDGPDTQVLVLEFVPRVGIEPAHADDVGNLLELMARLHCVDPGPGTLFAPRPGMPTTEFEARVQAALTQLAADPAVDVPVGPDAWWRAYGKVRRWVAGLPREVNHGEFYFQHVGRRAGTPVGCGAAGPAGSAGSGLVLFDAETTALLPRFTDLASVLADLAGTRDREHDLFLRYLAARQSVAGHRVPPDSGWAQVLAVRLHTSFEALPWLLTARESLPPSQTPRALARTMAADLASLRLAGPGRRRPAPASGH